MIDTSDRVEAIKLIDEAVASGASQTAACEEMDLNVRTLQRWRLHPEDGRPLASRPVPANKLSEAERQAVLLAANRPDCIGLTPHELVPKLADEGVYLASESTFYRVLRAAGQSHCRGRRTANKLRPATTHRATGSNQVWCWDITWLPSTIKGQYFYWYMVKDIYSRKLVVNEVHERESADHACELLKRGCLREQTLGKPLVLHSDNGSAMKGLNMLATMRELGVASSFSRPRVSNDNAYAEALFRTAKYCPMWPRKSFDGVVEARRWVDRFVRWYNNEHRHSGLKYVTPSQRHQGQDNALMEKRREVYGEARRKQPKRWTQGLRNWQLPSAVFLNPEREVMAVDKRVA